MEQLLTLLQGSLEARGKVLVKLNVAAEQLRRRHRGAARRCGRPPCRSCSAAAGSPSRPWCRKSEINVLIPALRDRGATDIIELALSKIVH